MKWIALAAAMVFSGLIFGGWVTSGVEMASTAMEPTITKGKLVFYSRKIPGGIRRGSIILFQAPNEEGPIIRRVVGLPGEKLEYRNGEVIVNDQKVEEKYLKMSDKEGPRVDVAAPAAFGPIVVPEGCYFVLGDNRMGARDSRTFLFVREEDVQGKVWAIFGGLVIGAS